MTQPILCLLCSSPLPTSALLGETLGPLLCDRHRFAETNPAGVLGYPNGTQSLYAPVRAIHDQIQGQRIVHVYHAEKPWVWVLRLEKDAALCLFPTLRTSFAQYVPGPLVQEPALAALNEVEQLNALVNRKLTSFEFGVDVNGQPSEMILAMRFDDGAICDIECLGSSFYEAESQETLGLFWRTVPEPNP